MASVINKIKVGSTTYNIASTAYATCTTAAATAAKVAYVEGVEATSGFTLLTGTTIHVKFTNTNTAANPTLNVNGTGAKAIMRYGTTAVSTSVYTSWQAGAIVSLTYDGTNWLLNDHKNENSAAGDITGVTAGSGLTGGATSGTATLNVGAGDGITVTADAVAAKAGSGITVNSDGINVNTGYTTSGKNYKVQVDSTSGGLYVNVPWTDTDTNTHNSHKINSGKKSDNSTDIVSAAASSGDITLGDSGVTAGTYKRVTVNAKGIVVGGDNTDADTHYTKYLQIKGNGTEAVKFTQDADKSLNLKPGTNVSISAASGEITISATDTNTWRPVGTGATDAAAGNHTHDVSIAASSGTNELTLAHGTKYALTAGGQSFIFTMPSDNNTNTDRSSLAYCETAASTAAKTATMPGFALSSGQYIFLRTTTTNSATSNVTLNINSTGNKPVKIGNSSTNPTASNFPAGDYLAKYDGTNWILTRIYLTDNNTTYSAATTSAEGLMSKTDKSKLDGIATGATKVTTDTVSGWGYTKNTGTVTQVKVGTTAYNPSSGIVSLPAYPSVPTKTSDLTNDSGFITGISWGNVTDKPSFATVAGTGSYNDLTNKPTIPTKSSWNYDDSYVKYSAAQSLTDAQKTQARSNIGAGTSNLALGTTSTTAAKGDHTHTASLAADTGTSAITLSHGSKYKLTAGGSSVIFTMPSDNNTASAADNILDGSNSGTTITYAPYSSQQSKLSFDTSTTNPTRTDRLNINGYLYGTKLYSGGKEVLTSHQDISGKLDKNTAITGATKCKITYDNKGLVTAGANLAASDIPNLDASKITAMTGYSKASSASAIAASDSLNIAIGKLEKTLDGKFSTTGGTITGAVTIDTRNGVPLHVKPSESVNIAIFGGGNGDNGFYFTTNSITHASNAGGVSNTLNFPTTGTASYTLPSRTGTILVKDSSDYPVLTGRVSGTTLQIAELR